MYVIEYSNEMNANKLRTQVKKRNTSRAMASTSWTFPSLILHPPTKK